MDGWLGWLSVWVCCLFFVFFFVLDTQTNYLLKCTPNIVFLHTLQTLVILQLRVGTHSHWYNTNEYFTLYYALTFKQKLKKGKIITLSTHSHTNNNEMALRWCDAIFLLFFIFIFVVVIVIIVFWFAAWRRNLFCALQAYGCVIFSISSK